MWNTTAADLGKTVLGDASWIAIALLAIMIQIFIVALAYMLSKFFELPDLRRWVKSELAQVLASIILVVLLFTIVSGESYGVGLIQNQTEIFAGSIVVPGMAGLAKVSPFDASYVYLRAMLKCVESKYKETYKPGIERLLASDIIVSPFILRIPIPFKWFSYPLYSMIVEAHYKANSLTWLALALYFQYNLLQWVETAMFTVYLPIGIILRIFPYTRGAGALMIALAIGLYIVYPLMFVVILMSSGSPPSGCQAPQITMSTNICANDPAAFATLIKVAQAEAAMGSSGLGGQTVSMIVYAFFYPIVVLVVTFAFVRAIAPVLGADVSEMGRSLFKIL